MRMQALVACLSLLTARNSLIEEPTMKSRDPTKKRKADPQAAVGWNTHQLEVRFLLEGRPAFFWPGGCLFILSKLPWRYCWSA